MARSHSRSKSETESIQNFVRGLSISAPSNPRATLRMTPKNSPLKLITTFPSPNPDPIQRSATTSPTAEGKIGGVQRFFAWAGDRSGNKTPVSATATPIAMSAISPVEGGYWRRDPFGSMSAKTVNPGAAKLPPVTEMSPDTPKQHRQPSIEKLQPPPQEEKNMKISSPIEARNSMGFSESRGPVTFGDHTSNTNTPVPAMGSRTNTPAPAMGSRTNTPTPAMGSRTTTPVPVMGSRSGTPNPPAAVPLYQVAMAPAPPPPPPRRETPPVVALPQKPPTPLGSRPLNSPLPPPTSEVFHKDNGKNGSATRKPAGLAIQWPPMDTVIREGTPPIPVGPKHKRTGSRNTPPIPNGRPAARTEASDLDGFLTLLDNVNNKRMDSQRAAPRLAVRRRAESPDIRARSGSRNTSRQRSSDRRGRQVGRQDIPLTRSPSSPLPMSPQARLYREDIEEDDLHEDDFEDERYYTKGRRVASRSRGRTESRKPAASTMRSPSSPLPSSAQAKLYRDEGDDTFDDERYYTVAPRNDSKSRARSRGRSNTRVPGSSVVRSPSSPLPMSPGAQMYAEMAHQAEQEERQPRHPRRMTREDSRGRVYGGGGIRRSRSEHTMRQWSDQLERAGAMERRPSVSGTMNRKLSIRGLPATPRAWKNDLGSRAGSPVPTLTRGASMAMTPEQRSMTTPVPSVPFSPAYRSMSPALSTLGAMTPAPRTFTPPLSGGSLSSNGSKSNHEGKGSAGLSAKPAPLRIQNFYPEEPDHYDPTRNFLPNVPPLPINHSRNHSAPNADFKPLIRKLPPQAPPDSPPPLPHDLPVHPALQMHLDPNTPGKKHGMARGKSFRRTKRNDDIMSPIDGVLRDHEQSIIVGIDGGEAALHWDNPNHYSQQQQRHHQEMQQLRRHGHSPSIGSQHSGHSGHSAHGPTTTGLRDSSEAIGSTNQF